MIKLALITVLWLSIMIYNVYHLHNHNVDYNTEQIDKDIGTDVVVDIGFTKISYNEAHAIELGITIGILSALTLHLSPIISILLLMELGLMATGINLTATVEHRIVSARAFLFTVRANPWYYLLNLIAFYILTTIGMYKIGFV